MAHTTHPPETPSPIGRLRRRILIENPRIRAVSLSTDHPSRDQTRISSEGPTIRGLRAAFEETPIKLRNLEAGWRDRRRLSGVKAAPAEPSMSRKVSFGRPDKASRTIKASRTVKANVRGSDNENSRKGDAGPPKQPLYRRLHETRHEVRSPPPVIGDALPPSPPPTPPPPIDVTKSSARPAHELLIPLFKASPRLSRATDIPEPILSSQLPPTNQSVRLTSRSSDTIHVHSPDTRLGITATLRGGAQWISVPQDGRSLYITTETNGLSRSRLIQVDEWSRWSEDDRRDWELVRRTVETYKRNTPRVKLYLPLGQLSITCSTLPDIVLTFDHTTDHSTASIQDVHTGHTKVRVRLSRVMGEITIDISHIAPQTGERLRSKRTIKSGSQVSVSGTDIPQCLEGILRHAVGWSRVEREGLRRMIELRTEWERYD